jgi:hypothetical protein
MGRRRLTLALLALAALLAAREASAQGRGIVDRFPEPRQVTRDFSNDPSRRVALQILYFALQEKTPAPRSEAASKRITDYFRAFGEVDYRYDRQGANSVARKNYYARVRQLLYDPNFKSAVLTRYALAVVPPERPLRPPARIGTTAQRAVDEIVRLLPRALPFWLATLAVITVLPSAFALFFDGGSPARASRAGAADDPLQLSDRLRVVNIFGKRFEFQVESGIVIQTDSTGGYDRVWIRNLSGHESTAAFASGIFPTRQGHIVSLVGDGRRLADGGPDYLLGFNHATTKSVPFASLEDALRVRASRLPWLAATVLGAAGLWFGLAAVAWRVGPAIQDSVDWSAVLLFGLCTIAVLAWISVRVTARVFFQKRMKRVATFLMGAFGLFFVLNTEKLEQRLGAQPQKGTT